MREQMQLLWRKAGRYRWSRLWSSTALHQNRLKGYLLEHNENVVNDLAAHPHLDPC